MKGEEIKKKGVGERGGGAHKKRKKNLNHWPKFKINSQNCSSLSPLLKLSKWFSPDEQNSRKTTRLYMSFKDIS